ncbi:hypothetical protein HY024_04805 [Candidatus Curtissbacteria bacterium]|nr:hypothetical protein [Candidatus Curtissbacteria bacterium]
MISSELPTPEPEAVYAEIGSISNWQLYVNVFKKLARESSVSAHHGPAAPSGGRNAEVFKVDGVSEQESLGLSLELTKQDEKRTVNLRVPGGFFVSEGSTSEASEEQVFILEESGLYTLDEIQEHAAFWARAARTFSELSANL